MTSQHGLSFSSELQTGPCLSAHSPKFEPSVAPSAALRLKSSPSISPQLDCLKFTRRVFFHLSDHHLLKGPLRFRALASLNSQGRAAEDDRSGFIRKKLAVFVSGGGSNFQTLHKAALEDTIYGDIVAVVSDKPACKACDYARSNNILVLEYPKNSFAPAGLSPVELVTALRQFEVDFVLLAGYLKLLPGELIKAYPRSILNVHPALLPAFGGKGYYGMKVHEAVVKSGARFSGPTVHFVDEKYDHGVILAQRVVPVLPYDTAADLATRVLNEEHILYPEAVAALCEDRIFWREDGVPLIRRSWDQADYY